MVQLPAFEVERWMDTHENTPGVLNIAETCCSSVSINQLVQFDTSKQQDGRSVVDPSARLGYGTIRGSEELRRNLATMYNEDQNATRNNSVPPVTSNDIIIQQGAIAANRDVFYSLVGPGDHVVCVFPTYQQLYSIPKSLGAEVSLWELKQSEGYVPNVGDLEALIKDNTKMVVINNPNNPTGATIPVEVLEKIVSVAKKNDIILFSDEVYQPLFHGVEQDSIPPSILALNYPKTVVTGSMSKAWALAGLRLGWAASRDASIIDAIASARDYTTISVSGLDDQVARYALSASVRPQLLARNISLAKKNLDLLARFVEDHPTVCTWVRPNAGTTAFLGFKDKNGAPVDDEAFCKDVLSKTKVFFVPGSRCFGNGETSSFNGFVRIGYVCETEVLRQALEELSGYIADHLV
ncbi:PLP-dependent transferase [Hypoxylon trugodes]|uniref:PLP-dependent transferase n=1 Tax=Hypoxylon trugodes TaxID=326681 RepID=UPI00219BCB63|nr:PLP-dependent transferase [Hypoxylon trugodes]KAI1393018.1 PLP-dependent transferase [Hypoxylon trugodes]